MLCVEDTRLYVMLFGGNHKGLVHMSYWWQASDHQNRSSKRVLFVIVIEAGELLLKSLLDLSLVWCGVVCNCPMIMI